MNIILATDSYKLTHWLQYPKGTTRVHSYMEARGGRYSETVFFGLQYYIQKYLAGPVVTREYIEEAAAFCKEHFGSEELFNRAGWEHILNQHKGFLPVVIRAVPEGSVIPTGNVLLTITNTDDQCFWLPNLLETLLLKLWYPITVATNSREIKKILVSFLEKTGDPSKVDFMLHDFGYRGVSSEESAAIGGAAHMLNFRGSDTIAGILMARKYYDEQMAGFSVPASEHSTITSWGRDAEVDAYENMLDKYPTGIVSIVSDSYNIFNACENLYGQLLKEKIENRKGTLVVRPDSGSPVLIVTECLQILGRQFGTTLNSKGFKMLPSYIRVMQGDGVNSHSIKEILDHITKLGWSSENVLFGMGGALLQMVNRDDQKFAFKAAMAVIDGIHHDVQKDPITDAGKKSKTGEVTLVKNLVTQTYRSSVVGAEVQGSEIEYLFVRFRNGYTINFLDFEGVRHNSRLG
jgi:nicotinamide phosphoribosyltransferase